jgi:hypothetical protein
MAINFGLDSFNLDLGDIFGEKIETSDYPSIGRIKSKVLRYGDFAFTNRYRVYISPPRKHIGHFSNLPVEKILINCSAVTLPGKSYATHEDNNLLGPIRKYPYKEVHDDMSMTFYCQKNMAERLYFEQWQDLMYDRNLNQIQYYKEYVTDIVIDILARDTGFPTYSVTLEEAYPITIAPLEMTYESDDIVRQTITFAYRKWTRTFDSVEDINERTHKKTTEGGGIFDFNGDISIDIPNVSGRIPIKLPGIGGDFGINF